MKSLRYDLPLLGFFFPCSLLMEEKDSLVLYFCTFLDFADCIHIVLFIKFNIVLCSLYFCKLGMRYLGVFRFRFSVWTHIHHRLWCIYILPHHVRRYVVRLGIHWSLFIQIRLRQKKKWNSWRKGPGSVCALPLMSEM